MQIVVVVPGAGVTTVVFCGGLGSLLLNDTQPARQIGSIRITMSLDMVCPSWMCKKTIRGQYR
ncbi:MAG TPA: hypothetical protein DD502_12395 [Cupriavidus sp.]|nr:hypothetical protein [Cupriavidus sp.]